MERLIREKMNLIDITVEELEDICFKLHSYEDTDFTPEEIQKDIRIHKEMYEEKFAELKKKISSQEIEIKELSKKLEETTEWEKYYSEQMESANNDCKSAYNQLVVTQNELNRIKAERDKWELEAIKAKAELGEMKIAEGQWKFIKLPCNVGDTVYEIDEWFKEHGIITCEVFGFHYKNELSFYVKVIEGHGKGSGYEFSVSDIGKTVFLTREEAEEALKGGGAE